MNKIKLTLIGVAGALASFVGVAHAATTTPLVIPATLGSDFLAFAGSQLADPGTIIVLLVVLGIPLAFYLAKKIRSLIPK